MSQHPLPLIACHSYLEFGGRVVLNNDEFGGMGVLCLPRILQMRIKFLLYPSVVLDHYLQAFECLLVRRTMELPRNVNCIYRLVLMEDFCLASSPDFKFRDHVREDGSQEEPKKQILKRESASFEEVCTDQWPDHINGVANPGGISRIQQIQYTVISRV